MEINIDPLCVDDKGDRVAFDYELHRQDVEKLIEPFVLRSINICKKVLTEKRLEPGNIQKLILVGGPTLTPYLRQRLADPRDGLGLPLEFSVDPLTIVAKGAAIFAGTQRLEEPATAPTGGEVFNLQLEYQPVGSDPEPLVGGKVLPPPGTDLVGYTIEFLDGHAHPPRRSGKLTLTAEGTFMTNLWAEKGRTNTYLIELHDPNGRKCAINPDRFTYSMGVAPTDPPLIHSLGIATINNEMEVFIPKGTALPVQGVVQRTGMVHRKGPNGDAIRIPLIEGENLRRADRNRHIGTLLIKPDLFNAQSAGAQRN